MILGGAEWVFRKLFVGPKNSKSDTVVYYNTETSGGGRGKILEKFVWGNYRFVFFYCENRWMRYWARVKEKMSLGPTTATFGTAPLKKPPNPSCLYIFFIMVEPESPA